jgi:hypothetical protein
MRSQNIAGEEELSFWESGRKKSGKRQGKGVLAIGNLWRICCQLPKNQSNTSEFQNEFNPLNQSA